jgi:molybdenum cofactor sulfurtransferase
MYHIPGSFPAAPPSPPDSDSERSSASRRILLSNESPILAITVPSLDALNHEIRNTDPDGSGISHAVFRANIVIGPSKNTNTNNMCKLPPYAEDSWSGVRIGQQGWEFDMLGACRRCHMVCINQETAEKSEEPFVTLSKTRRFDGKVFFGVHMGLGGGGLGGVVPTVRVGDGVVPVWRE